MLTLQGCQKDYFKSLKNFEKKQQNKLNLHIICHYFYPIKYAAQAVNYNKMLT